MMPPAPALYSACTRKIAAHLQAGVGAGNVVEPIPVQAADLHVLNRRCLDRHVGCLRPSDRDKSRRRPEEKSFNRSSSQPPFVNWEGSISSGAAHPGRFPLLPTLRSFSAFLSPKHRLPGRSDQGCPPPSQGDNTRRGPGRNGEDTIQIAFRTRCCLKTTRQLAGHEKCQKSPHLARF